MSDTQISKRTAFRSGRCVALRLLKYLSPLLTALASMTMLFEQDGKRSGAIDFLYTYCAERR